jgi:beta-glucosidase
MASGPVKFPHDFLWGASISAHQAEGFNVNDWSEWEHENAVRLAAEAEGKFAHKVPDWESIRHLATAPSNYISGQAADHYARYKEDIALAKELRLNAFRFSIEWSRIEPKEGEYDQQAIDHYVDLIRELKKAGIEPVVTLHHRTNPLWVKEQNDWQNPKTVDDFARYASKMVGLLKDEVRFWMPINEPMMSLTGGYLGGVYPPGKKNLLAALRVFKNMVAAHDRTYGIVHSNVRNAQVGLSHASVLADPYKNKLINRLTVKLLHYLANYLIMDRTTFDFIGVQYYTRAVIDVQVTRLKVEEMPQPGPYADMGWPIYAEGLYRHIKQIARYKKPIYVTENGITDTNDKLRADYIKQHLYWLHRAMEEGIEVKGYFYWSFLDNLEWDKGFWPRFGLIEVDYGTYERKVRPSAREYSEIIKNSGF